MIWEVDVCALPLKYGKHQWPAQLKTCCGIPTATTEKSSYHWNIGKYKS